MNFIEISSAVEAIRVPVDTGIFKAAIEQVKGRSARQAKSMAESQNMSSVAQGVDYVLVKTPEVAKNSP